MRCLLLIALCVAAASASFYNRNRFQRLLNRYQNRYDLDTPYGLPETLYQPYGLSETPYGLEDVDDYVDDYVDQIRRERLFDRDQCPRDIEGILGGIDEEYLDEDLMGLEDIPVGLRGVSNSPIDLEGVRGLYDTPIGLEGLRGGLEDVSGLYDEELLGETGSTGVLLKEVRDANRKLASRLYKQIRDEKDDKNTVVSPLSVQLALAALNIGARGSTKRQIGHIIAGNLKKHERRQIFRTIIRHLKGLRQAEYSPLPRTSQIKPVIGIFVNQQTPSQQQFIRLVKTNLGANVKHVSFQHQPQQSRQIINQFVAQKTQGKIRNIVPQDAITDNTKMVLVNSMHVKATWGPQMLRHQIKEAKFYPLDSKKVKIVEVLETTGRFKYHEDELVKIVGVPTQQQELTLYVIVPKEKDGLTEVEKLHLQDNVQLQQLLKQTDMKVRHVGVQLPKFQIKHKVDVRRTLRQQGCTDAFDPIRADFSGITGIPKYQQDEIEDTIYNTYSPYEQMNSIRRNPLLQEELIGGTRPTKLHLNKFIHQSSIKITEQGITAVSGSGSPVEDIEEYRRPLYSRLGDLETDELNTFDEITGFNLRQTGEKKIVKANRAFAFVVKHNPTNQLVFVGRVIDAAQKKVNHVPQTINVVDQY